MKLELDDYLRKQGNVDIRTIKNNIVILTNLLNKKNELKENRFEIKFNEGQTEEEISNSLEEKLDKPLGRDLCQYIIQHICKPENFTIVSSYSNSNSKNGPEVQEPQKAKYSYDNFEQWQISIENAYHKSHKVVYDNVR